MKNDGYNYYRTLSDSYPVLDSETRPYIQSDPPDYGRPNRGYSFVLKYGTAMKASAFFFMLFTICSLAVILFTPETNDPPAVKAYAAVSVTRHGGGMGDAFSLLMKKKAEGNPELIAKFDSLMEADRAAAKEADELVKQHIRDSILQYVHARDSVRLELLRQDSVGAELAVAGKTRIDYIAIIDDGVTKRTVNVNSVSDTLAPETVESLGGAFTAMSVDAARERQDEIDKDDEYYGRVRMPVENSL